MAYYLVNGGMTLATVCFVLGYVFRRDVERHRTWMGFGVVVVVITAAVLVVAVHVVHGGDRAAAGFHAAAPPAIILTHRIVAAITTLLMLGMAITGAQRRREIHVLLHRFFVPLYVAVYVSGLLIFSGSP